MATKIDALQLNITGSNRKALDSIDGLVRSLETLGQKLGMIDTQGFSASAQNIVDGVTNIGNAFNNANSANIKDFSSSIKSLATATKNLAGVENVGSAFEGIANGIENISGIAIPDFSNISTLSIAISKLGSGNAVQASEILTKLSDGLKSFSGVAIPNLEGIEVFAQGLRSLGSKNVATAASALQPLGEALRNFPTNIPAVSGLSELAQSLSMFGRKTAVQAVDTIPELATAFRQLIAELANAPAVSNNVVQLTNALARFVQNVNRVGNGSTQASKGLNLFGNMATRVSKKTFSLASAIGKVYATYFLLFRAFGKIREAIDISSDLVEVQNVVDTTFGDMAYKAEEFADTALKSFGMTELSAKEISSRFQSMGVTMSIPASSVAKAQQQLNSINPELATRGYSDAADSVADMSINITKLAGDMASLYNKDVADVAKDLESVWTGQTKPLTKYGLSLTNATLKEFALQNGLNANISSMSQAEKTLLRYQYVLANTSAAQGDFAKTSAKHMWRAA